MPISEQEFNAIVDRIAATAPKGISEAEFTKLLDAEAAKMAVPSPEEGFVSEATRRIKSGLTSAGNAIGDIFNPGRQFNEQGMLMPKQYDAQGRPIIAKGGMGLGNYIAAHPVRTAAELAMMGTPFMVQAAKPLVAPIIAKAAEVLQAPAAGAAVGAAEGYSRGGVKGALIGGAIGAAGGGVAGRMARSMGRIAPPPIEVAPPEVPATVAEPAVNAELPNLKRVLGGGGGKGPEVPNNATAQQLEAERQAIHPTKPKAVPGVVASKAAAAENEMARYFHLRVKPTLTAMEQMELDQLNAKYGGMRSAARANR